MRYQVRLINNPHHPILVEATEFHTTGHDGGITFFSERTRPTGGVDQWGQVRTQRQRVSVAFFNNVESVLEFPEENPGIPEPATEGFHDEFVTTLNGNPPGAAPWGDDRVGGVGRANNLVGAVAPDDDGVDWDELRAE